MSYINLILEIVSIKLHKRYTPQKRNSRPIHRQHSSPFQWRKHRPKLTQQLQPIGILPRPRTPPIRKNNRPNGKTHQASGAEHIPRWPRDTSRAQPRRERHRLTGRADIPKFIEPEETLAQQQQTASHRSQHIQRPNKPRTALSTRKSDRVDRF